MNNIEAINANSTSSAIHTPAYAGFDFNTDRLSHYLEFMVRGIKGISKEINFSKVENILFAANALKKESDEENTVSEKNVKLITEQQTQLRQEIADYNKRISANSSGFSVGLEWMPVLVVTIVEAYLRDVLVYVASIDSTLMKNSEISASYAEMTNASSLEELLQGLRYQWARKFLSEGGPKHWIQALTKMGARGYSSEVEKEMETLWGVRHLIVHSTGIATPDFVRRHPDFGVAVGKRIQVELNQLDGWLEHIYRFVDLTDAYFVQRYKLKSPET